LKTELLVMVCIQHISQTSYHYRVFIYGNSKAKVYRTTPHTIEELKEISESKFSLLSKKYISTLEYTFTEVRNVCVCVEQWRAFPASAVILLSFEVKGFWVVTL